MNRDMVNLTRKKANQTESTKIHLNSFALFQTKPTELLLIGGHKRKKTSTLDFVYASRHT